MATDFSPSVSRRAPGSLRQALWVGPTAGIELEFARRGLAAHLTVIDVSSPQEAVRDGGAGDRFGRTPVFAALAADRPGRFSAADPVLLSKRWPLMPIVSVASSLADGRRRSGPTLPGIEEVPWHDLAARCAWWLAAADAGVPTSLGLPAAARREERLLGTIGGLRRRTAAGPMPTVDVSAAATRPEDLEGICDLLTSLGHRVSARHLGRPRPEDPSRNVVWDVLDLTPDDIEWVRLLVANRPGLFLVMLASFPRGDAVQAALGAGAAAVLGRPVAVEAVAGSLVMTA